MERNALSISKEESLILPHARDGLSEKPSDEIALIQAAKANPKNFAALYRHYLPQVYRYLRVRVKREEDVEDLTQQIFLKAFDSFSRYQEGKAPFAAWLFSIASHTVTDALRRQRTLVPLDGIPEGLLPFAQDDPEALMLQQERVERLRNILRTLDTEKRELIALRFAAGLNATEIAAITGKRTEAVRKQLSRLLHTLKEHYHADI